MSKTIIMTIPQFNAIQRGELTYKDLEVETLASKILKDARLTKCFVLSVAFINIANKYYADVTAVTSKIDTAGNLFLDITQSVARWTCLVMCLVEITKNIMNGNTKEIVKIMFKYLLAFATTFLMPFAFDMIESIFN